jgi:hypothetical protein
MMKRRILGASLIALTIMLGTVSLVAALGENATIFPEINSSPNGVIWWFKTEDPSGIDFNGRDIDRCSIVAAYADPNGDVFTIKPLLILLTKEYVMLVFCPRSLPPKPAEGEEINFIVVGTLKTGEFAGQEFFALGPGFGRGARP